MIGNKCLLDTNVIINSFKRNNDIGAKLDAFDSIYVSATVVGELFYGAYKSANPVKHIIQVEVFLANCIVLPIDKFTGETYGKIKTALSINGKPIPENDIWIAATSLQYALPLFTNDAHFNEVEGLDLIK